MTYKGLLIEDALTLDQFTKTFSHLKVSSFLTYTFSAKTNMT